MHLPDPGCIMLIMPISMISLRRISSHWLPDAVFIALFLFIDWIGWIDPMFGLNITPWNPDPALGLVFWLKYGKRAALPWFIALMVSETIVHGSPANWVMTMFFSGWLTIGYGLIGVALRKYFRNNTIFDTRKSLFVWLSIVVSGVVFNSLVYISLLYLAHLIPAGQWGAALVRFGAGDIVGIVTCMPLFWVLINSQSRYRLATALLRWETVGYVVLAACALGIIALGFILNSRFKHYYFVSLPIIWAATRQGLHGAVFVTFVLLTGVILMQWEYVADVPILELQLLGAILTMIGFFIGVVVDEQKRAADELKYTLRLAAAGEMAAALAHELNQPMTALLAYGNACRHLLESGETGGPLKDAIHKMAMESERASNVVRRLRDFFRVGAVHLEIVSIGTILSTVMQQFSEQFRKHDIIFIAGSIPDISINADRLQIELVLRNLLANAVDSIVGGTREGRYIKLSGELLYRGTKLRLSVEDSGPGISQNVAMRLFEPFVSSKPTGLGLGLVLSRAIVEAHGGSLWAEIGDHGIFRFVLPLAGIGEEIDK